MNLVKLSPIEAGITVSTDKHGYEHILVIAKATFDIKLDGTCVLAEQQQPLIYEDEFYGEPGFSAVRYESDFALYKPKADILLNGSAYAPGGRPVKNVTVTLQVGNLIKSFNAVGNRYWKRGLVTVSPSEPKPFISIPISYDNAFGGVDDSHKNPDKHSTYLVNHAGIGYYTNPNIEVISGKPLPNSEELDNPITKPDGKYSPMSFGPLGRAWQPRASYSGTYDQEWLDERFPFLPLDFDDHYFQAAHPDQTCDYLKGGEVVRITNLSPEGRLAFKLPVYNIPIKVFYESYNEEIPNVLDTLIIEPDLKRCILTYRTSTQLKGKLNKVKEIWVGTPTGARNLAIQKGKRYVNWAEVA